MKTPTSLNDFRGVRRTMQAVGPEFRDRMRATLEDAGVTRQQWRILAALKQEPMTADSIDASAKRRHPKRTPDSAAAAAVDPMDQTDGSTEGSTDRDRGHLGHPFGGGGVGRFGRRGFGPGFGPFGRGFGPGFGRGFGPGYGPGFGPHADHHGRRRPTTDVLNGLAERGWVQRADSADAESPWALTETGAAELERIRTTVDAMTASLRDGISDDDWDTAMSVLQRVAQNVQR